MIEKIKRLPTKIDLEMILENAYLLIFVVWVSYAFLGTTTFEIEWPEHFFTNLKIVMFSLVLTRIAYSKSYNWKEVLLVVAYCIVFLFAADRNGYEDLKYTLLFILGAKGISFRKLIKVYFMTTTILLVFTMWSALTGRIEHLVYLPEGRRVRRSFGIIYPTDFSAHVFYGILSYLYIRSERLKYVELGAVAVVGGVVYWLCDTRLNFICIIGTVILFTLHKMKKAGIEKQGKTYEMNTVLSGLMSLSTTICAIIMIGLTVAYGWGNKLITVLDSLLTGRLGLGFKGVEVIGFSFWGQRVPMTGMGRSAGNVKYYFFLDSSYLYVALQYGLIVLGMVLLTWLLIGIKSKSEGDWCLLMIVAIVAVQCLVEHHMLEIAYNPFLWALFAEYKVKKKREGQRLSSWKNLMKSEVAE